MSTVKEIIPEKVIVPVVTLASPAGAVPLAETLLAAGIPVVEITLRAGNAMEAVRSIRESCPGMIAGIGTVLNEDQVGLAAEAGAAFVVSPGFTQRLAESALRQRVPYLPGVSTVSEIMMAAEFEFDLLKFYPARLMGGVPALRQFATLFPDLAFCPTGGLDEQNSVEFLRLDNVHCIGASWPVPAALVDAADWEGIARLARRAADCTSEVRR